MFRCELCGEGYNFSEEVMLLDCNDIAITLDQTDFIEHEVVCNECYETIYYSVINHTKEAIPMYKVIKRTMPEISPITDNWYYDYNSVMELWEGKTKEEIVEELLDYCTNNCVDPTEATLTHMLQTIHNIKGIEFYEVYQSEMDYQYGCPKYTTKGEI